MGRPLTDASFVAYLFIGPATPSAKLLAKEAQRIAVNNCEVAGE
jgi:hypothetical protein